MLKPPKLQGWLFLILVFPFAGANLTAQQAKQLAPIPAPLAAAHTVFVAEGSVDAIAVNAFQNADQFNEPYNSVYQAMTGWGRYQVVTSPKDADLVLEVSFAAPMIDCGNVPTYSPQLRLIVLDGKTHFVLWTFTQPVKAAFLKGTWEKNYAAGVAALIGQMKGLVGPPAP